MRAYVGHVGYSGLRRFDAEDVFPGTVLRELVREWASTTATVVQAVIPDDGAEEIRRQLMADRPHAACVALLNHAVELIPLRPDVRDPLARPYARPASFSR
jgi:hypothetical protein